MLKILWYKLIVHPNTWYDGLREPGRFLLFMSAMVPSFFLIGLEGVHAKLGFFCLMTIALPRMAFVVWRNTR